MRVARKFLCVVYDVAKLLFDLCSWFVITKLFFVFLSSNRYHAKLSCLLCVLCSLSCWETEWNLCWINFIVITLCCSASPSHLFYISRIWETLNVNMNFILLPFFRLFEARNFYFLRFTAMATSPHDFKSSPNPKQIVIIIKISRYYLHSHHSYRSGKPSRFWDGGKVRQTKGGNQKFKSVLGWFVNLQ